MSQFGAKIRKNVYPCKPQFYYIKVGCKGVCVTRTCFRDEYCVYLSFCEEDFMLDYNCNRSPWNISEEL